MSDLDIYHKGVLLEKLLPMGRYQSGVYIDQSLLVGHLKHCILEIRPFV